MISGLRKISIYNPSTGVVVQLNHVAPDGDVKIRSPLHIMDPDGEYVYDGDESYFEFGFYDRSNAYDQLKTWMDAGTGIRIVGTGIEQNLLWRESVPILIEKKMNMGVGNRNFIICRVAKKRGTHDIKLLSNLVRTGGKWVDADVDEEVDCLTFSGTGSRTFFETADPTYQYMTGGASGDTATTGLIVFPVSGVALYAKMNQKVQSPSQVWTLYLQIYNYSSLLLTQATASSVDSLLSINLPATTYHVRITISVSLGNNVKFHLPYLGVKRNDYSNINY